VDLLEDLRRTTLGLDLLAAHRAEQLLDAIEFSEWTEQEINRLLDKLGAGELTLLNFAIAVAREMSHRLQYVLEEAGAVDTDGL